tara:strand:- start:1261 stop:2001 length:741 start_codon:yes stop_codon:yes gene_type:complete
MYGKEISKCINAAEMGLTKRQAATLLDIQYSLVKELADKYGIKFLDGRNQAGNERRFIESHKEKQEAVITYDRKSPQESQAKPKTRTRRNTSTNGHCITPRNWKLSDTALQKITEIYVGDLPRAEKYERIYSEKWMDFENQLIKANKRQPFPKAKNFDIENAANRLIKEQREESLAKRKMILACFNGSGHRVAEDISEQTKFNLRSSSQMLDLMYRDGLLTRERVQVGANKRNSVYHYNKKQELKT